jgi:hypothetical protein
MEWKWAGWVVAKMKSSMGGLGGAAPSEINVEEGEEEGEGEGEGKGGVDADDVEGEELEEERVE